MATTNAFDIVFERAKNQLEADGNTANVLFGARERGKRINYGPGQANRVVFVPGDPKGELGEYDGAVRPRRPSFQGNTATRTLGTLRETFGIYCWAFDVNEPESERAQYNAARFLHDQVVRALHISSHGNYELGKPYLVPQPVERKFGCEIVITLVILARIPDDPGPPGDAPFTTVKPTTGIGPTILEPTEPGTEDGEDTTVGGTPDP